MFTGDWTDLVNVSSLLSSCCESCWPCKVVDMTVRHSLRHTNVQQSQSSPLPSKYHNSITDGSHITKIITIINYLLISHLVPLNSKKHGSEQTMDIHIKSKGCIQKLKTTSYLIRQKGKIHTWWFQAPNNPKKVYF